MKLNITLKEMKAAAQSDESFNGASPARKRQVVFNILEQVKSKPHFYRLTAPSEKAIERWANSLLHSKQGVSQ